MGTEVIGRWGTWEELLLGGAVLRHGTRDWNVVAAELRARTVCPYTFTPEVCKAKYEDLQQRYSGSTAWFEELKKTRVAELKKALERSEDSIGSLESKLEVLKAEKSEKNDNLALALYEGQLGCCKKRRGKRKRKDCSRNIKETTSVGESDLLDSTDVISWCKESSTSNYGEVAKSSVEVDDKQNKNSKRRGTEDMVKILDSIFETKGASAFRRRLDGQKRGRYKKMIRRHMDFDTIRSRISNQTIKSTVELFRDLLLLTNNALVFYSKNTREYKTALLLREIVTKKMRESFKDGYSIDSSSKVSKITEPNESMKLPVHNLHVKPRSVRPGNRKIIAKAGGGNNSASGTSQGAKKPIKADSSHSVESVNVMKNTFGRPKRVERVTSDQKASTSMKGKKRVRTKS